MDDIEWTRDDAITTASFFSSDTGNKLLQILSNKRMPPRSENVESEALACREFRGAAKIVQEIQNRAIWVDDNQKPLSDSFVDTSVASLR